MTMAFVTVGLFVVSFVFGALHGTLDAVSAAAMSGAQSALELCFSMAGALCLWNGVMTVLERSSLGLHLGRALRLLLRRIFPQAGRDEETLTALSGNLSANLLGLGNAATPMGIRAATRMAAHCSGRASNELCRLVVLNTASVQLLPTTVAALRSAAGCAAPLDILPAVWLASLFSVTAGLGAAWLLEKAVR
ncbi:MAG: spore maturation protein A [Oscillospiraceae bacterium]|nr:spore maturation protein A [Oscillospiraceae bacterium]